MNYGIRKLSNRTKLVAAALALALAGVSHAQTQVGGGATLPSIGYVGSAAASNLQVWGTSSTNTSDPLDTHSLFGAWQALTGNPNVSYCLTGSGAGKDILAGGSIGGTSYNVQNNCVKNSAGTVTGFGAGLTGVNRTDLTQPNFAAGDSPLAFSDYSNYLATHGNSDYPTQFPAVAGAVAIAFNLVDDQGTPVTTANFTDAQLCNIFSGVDNNWSDSDLSGAFTLPATHTVNQAIKVAYRSDGSGTTFSFSNHLAFACSGTASAHFVTDQAFTNVDSLFKTFPVTGWLPASGNAAVAAAIQNNEASIGYVETANALATAPSISIATVNGKSPTANFSSSLTIAASDLAFNSVINGANATNGQAVVSTISSLITGSQTAPSTQCIALVQPSTYAVPGTIVPSTSYPIVAISYLFGNVHGNGTDLTNTRSLLEAPYNSTIQASATDIGGSTGLQYLTLGLRSFTAAQVGNCLVD
ncbi:substrate-binding domain-containing protein [Dyella acidiphila]|uniref:Substrate-binding domain-containing protein n=1 Tax=Dyella acidiphila TaxID=2775866 RepID=A0ABR9GED2_9GAMM|nr:substrate-binding domain-containing protein [Dyella acidiphila]MBE1162409.1 substrate-binding domain-containing protein [Dyella acidiphila]